MFSSSSSESFKCSLHDALASNVNPRTGSHLAVHGQAESLEPIEFRIIRPVADKI